MMSRIALIAFGGAAGALLRFVVGAIAIRLTQSAFPYATLAVNLVGCLAIGFLWALSERIPFDVRLSSFLFVGVLGSFTTFSTYGLELLNLIRAGHIGAAFLYFAVSNLGGLGAAGVGYAFGRTAG